MKVFHQNNLISLRGPFSLPDCSNSVTGSCGSTI